MAYELARALLNSRLEKSLVITLYRDMKSRDICPDQWDRQLKFWSDLIKRWGREACVIDFSAAELTKAWMYDSLYPPLQGSLALLVKTKVLRTREDFLKQPSLLSRMISYVWHPDPAPSDCYVFETNVCDQAQQICEDIASSAALITDLCITKDYLAQHYPTIDNELLSVALARMKGTVDAFDGGFYIHAPGFKWPQRNIAGSVITTKQVISRIDKEIRSSEEIISKEYAKAATYKRQGRTQQALLSLKRKKISEQRVERLESMKDKLERQLDHIGNGDLTETTVQHMKACSNAVKGPSVEEVEDLMDEMAELNAVVGEVSTAVAGQPIDDAELEEELNKLMGKQPTKVMTFETPQATEEPKQRRKTPAPST